MPLLFKKKVSKSTRIAVWAIQEEEEVLLQLLPPLRTADKEHLDKISFIPRRLEWLASRVLIHQMTGLYPETRYHQNGQPYISNCPEFVSISHTKGYAAISLSTITFPGIDIEFPSHRIEKVAKRFLNESEKSFLDPAYTQKQLGLIWCTKEAIFKKAGTPGLVFKNQIIARPFIPKSQEGQLSASLQLTSTHEDINLEYLISQDFYLVWIL
ncbi:4'-phosphopantetheinyl transferase family protein [Marinilabilia sp.]|jgi:phosphopantetheinyl transferase